MRGDWKGAEYNTIIASSNFYIFFSPLSDPVIDAPISILYPSSHVLQEVGGVAVGVVWEAPSAWGDARLLCLSHRLPRQIEPHLQEKGEGEGGRGGGEEGRRGRGGGGEEGRSQAQCVPTQLY